MRIRLERFHMGRMNAWQSLSWVTDTFRKDADPELERDMKGIAGSAFITQLAPNIRRRVQKWEAGPWTPLSKLVEEAFKVYNNRGRVWWGYPAEWF